MKLVKKQKENVRIVINGAGAAAISISKLLLKAGYPNITLCDRKRCGFMKAVQKG